jgi:hypothetical protein
MNSWFKKFLISLALDRRKPLPESLRQNIAADPELAHFVRQTDRLKDELPQRLPTDPGLHDDIMRAVRLARPAQPSRQMPAWTWFVASAAAAVLLLASIWIPRSQPAPPHSAELRGPFMVLELSEKMPRTMPSVMAPLTNELAKVDFDVRKTSQVIGGCIPFWPAASD